MMKKVCGVNVAYTDHGAGRPLILMHGNPDSRHSWNPLIERLGEGIRIIAPDFPGFGESEPLPEDYNLGPEGMAHFWNEFINGLSLLEPVTVVVHDFGGPWLLPWVAENPERVHGLLILNTTFHRDFTWHFWAKVWQTPILGELSMIMMNRLMFRLSIQQASPHHPEKDIQETYGRMHTTMKQTTLRFYRAYADSSKVFKVWEQKLQQALNQITTRVIWGDKDPFAKKEFADKYGVVPERLPEVGHWPQITATDTVAKTLQQLVHGSYKELSR